MGTNPSSLKGKLMNLEVNARGEIIYRYIVGTESQGWIT